MGKDNKSSGKLSWKIVAGVLVVSLAAGSGLAVYRNGNASAEESVKSNGTKSKGSAKSTESKSDLSDEELKQAKLLKQNVDTDYIAKVCTYFDETSSLNDVTDKELAKMYERALDSYCTVDKYHSDQSYYSDDEEFDITRYQAGIVIDDDQKLAQDSDQSEYDWSFKGSVFDKFNQIAGIDTGSRNVEIKADNVIYDGENYNVDYAGLLDDSVKCVEITSLITNPEEMIVNLEKTEENEDGKTKVTKEHAVVVPADNDYGYKIKSIEDGYVKKAQLLDVMADVMPAWAISTSLENYDSNQKVDETTLKTLAKAGATFGRNTYFNYDVDEDEYKFDRSMFNDMCTLIGVSKKDANVDIQTDKLTLNSSRYTLENSSKAVDYIASCLRHEADYKKNEVSYYYLMAKTVDQKADKYVKKMITLEPADNIYGYRIKKITTEEWDDKYFDEFKEVEDKTEAIQAKMGTTIDSKYMKKKRKIANSWIDEMQSLVERISKKYPDQKEAFEKNQKEYWDDWVAEVEADEQLDEFYLLEYKTYYARLRCLYLMGNALMDDHIDAVIEN